MPDINPEITEEDVAAIKVQLAEADKLLPKAPVLTDAELRKLQQVKGRRLPFILRALTAAKDNPDAVPSKVIVSKWDASQADYLAADEVEAELMKRLSTVRLYKAVKGHEAYAASRKFYRNLRDNIADYGELKPLLDELSALFEGQGDEGDEDDGENTPPSK